MEKEKEKEKEKYLKNLIYLNLQKKELAKIMKEPKYQFYLVNKDIIDNYLKNAKSSDIEKFIDGFIKKEIHSYCYKTSDCSISDNTNYPIKKVNYSICVYGPKAKNGGKGGKVCGQNYFSYDTTLKFVFGGREAGGEGGKGCGFLGNGNGHNGAGYTMAYLQDESFKIIAGGGGGNSESGNAGGDAEKDGKGLFYGRGATQESGGEGGDKNSDKEKGSPLRGGSGESIDKRGKYCGGGGGSGCKGGGAGDWGDKGNDGGGGGGSNCCKAQKCESSEINEETEFSCVEIFNITKKK